jgi:hypothetical protein
VSWGAILAGSVIALTSYLLFSALGVAIGFSVADRVGDQELGIGAIIWAIATTFVSLFIGGCVASQCAVGETKREAVIHGTVMWGVVFGMLLLLMASGVQMGFNALIGIASTPAGTAAVNRLSDEDLRAAGFTDEQIAQSRAQFDRLRSGDAASVELRKVASDPRSITAAWATFFGLLLSIVAAVGGSLLGAGPNLVLTGLGWRSTVVERREVPAREAALR